MPKRKGRRKPKPYPKGKGYEVVCPQCRESCHETTKEFNSKKEADGSMFKNKREFTAAHDQAWDEPVIGGGSGVLVCLMCDGALAPSGRLEVRELGAPSSGPAEDVEDKEEEPKLPVEDETAPVTPDHPPVDGKAELPPEMKLKASESAQEQPEPPNLALGEVVQKVDKEAFLCKDCETPFKTRQALSAHGRWCKNK